MLRGDAAALQCSDASLPLGFLPGAAYEVFRWVIFYVDAVASIAVVGNLTVNYVAPNDAVFLPFGTGCAPDVLSPFTAAKYNKNISYTNSQ